MDIPRYPQDRAQIECNTGKMPDISDCLDFGFYDRIMYREEFWTWSYLNWKMAWDFPLNTKLDVLLARSCHNQPSQYPTLQHRDSLILKGKLMSTRH